MSSLWDSFSHKIEYDNDILTYRELEDLITFLKELDVRNNNVVSNHLINNCGYSYQFRDYDTLLYDVRNFTITKEQLVYIIENVHSLDHTFHEVIMKTYLDDKHYWQFHKSYNMRDGTFENGKFIKK